jgi:hypothetical protein
MTFFSPNDRRTTQSPSTKRRVPCRLMVECLEDRTVPTALSISDGTATEGSSAPKLIDRFIPAGNGGLSRPSSLVFGPDGNHDGAQDLYILDRDLNAVLRYDGVTGSFIDTFVESRSGGLNSPGDLAFGPDGSLYVTSNPGNQLFRFDGASGAFLGVAVSGLANPLGITFGQDGSLYIANQGTNEVLRYDNSVLNPFVTAGSGGLSQPRQGVFGPDGNFYVASQGTAQVLRYNGLTGAYIGVFATTNIGQGQTQGPIWLEFGTDGYLYTTARTDVVGLNTSIFRFNATTGAFVDTLPIGRDSWSFMIDPRNVVYYSGNGGANYIERYGPSSPAALAAFTVSLSSPSAVPVNVSYSTADETALAGSDYTAGSGILTFVPGETTKTFYVPTIDDSIFEATETFTVNLSNAVGATIARGQAVGTILDTDTSGSVATATTLIATPNASTGGQLVTLTATVGPSPGNLGTISFRDNGVALAANVRVASGVAVFQVSTLAPGTHPLRADYSGATGFTTSTSNMLNYVVSVPAAPQLLGVTPNGNIASLAGDQRSRVASLVVAFDQPVQLDTSAMTLALHTSNVRLGGVLQPDGYGSLPTSLNLSTTDNITWTVTFTGNTDIGADGFHSLKDGVYDLNIDAAKVHPLGVPGVSMAANQTTTFHRLFGDTNPAATPAGGTPGTDFEAIDNTGDNLAFRNAFNKPAGGGYQAFLDFNGDGVINSGDNLQFRNRFNKSLTWRV